MKDEKKTKAQLIADIAELRREIADLKASAKKRKPPKSKSYENAEQLKMITDTIQDAVIMMDEDGKFSFWNPAAEKIFGYTKQEAIGRGFLFIFPEEKRKFYREAFLQFLDTGWQYGFGEMREYESIRKDGKRFPLEIFASVVTLEGHRQIVGIGRDITKRKRIEAELTTYSGHLEERVEERTAKLKKANEQLQQEIVERKRAEEALRVQRDLAVAFSSAPDLVQSLKETLKIITQICEMDCGGVYLVEPRTGELNLVAHQGVKPAFLENASHFAADSSQARLVMQGQPVYRHYSKMVPDLSDPDQREGLRSTAIIPVKHEGRVVAALNLASHTSDEIPFSTAHTLEIIAAQIGGGIARLHAETALRESEQRFRELVDLLPQTVYEMDLEDNFTFVNRFGLDFYGYTQEDVDKGIKASQIIAPEDRERVQNNIHRIVAQELSTGNEYKSLKKDGTVKSVIIYSSPIIREGTPVGLRGVVIDITERKRAEQALQESKDMLSALLNATDDAAFLVDVDEKILALNENFASRFGKRAEELIGTSAFQLLPLDLAKVRRKRILEILASAKPTHIEDERDGRIFYTSYCPILDEHGTAMKVAVFSRDITEQRRAEEHLRQLEHERAEIEKLAATGRMAARIAHEINNPLAGIKNSFQLIKSSIPKNHKYFSYVGLIEREIDRIARIVRGMIDLHRPIDILPRRFRVLDTIQEVTELLESGLREHEVSIQMKGISEELEVMMPEDYLRQVLYNILKNAIEASPQKGTVEVSATKGTQMLTITVSDQGAGIAQKEASKIFEPFFTTKSSRESGGLGLGLAISRGLVDVMDGFLDFESNADQGTTFRIVLPVEIKRKDISNG